MCIFNHRAAAKNKRYCYSFMHVRRRRAAVSFLGGPRTRRTVGRPGRWSSTGEADVACREVASDVRRALPGVCSPTALSLGPMHRTRHDM